MQHCKRHSATYETMREIDFSLIEGKQDSCTRVFPAVKCFMLQITQKMKSGLELFLSSV